MVAARPGTSRGALVAPLLAADGCVGALTAEIRNGGERLETVQAFATIFAAQLTSVLSASVQAASAGDSQSTAGTGRAASA